MANPALRHEAEESHRQDPSIDERRRLDKFDALGREMAARRAETAGRIQTLVDELRWRWQLRRSLSSGMTVTAWVISFLVLLAALLAVIVAVNVYEPLWALLLPASI